VYHTFVFDSQVDNDVSTLSKVYRRNLKHKLLLVAVGWPVGQHCCARSGGNQRTLREVREAGAVKEEVVVSCFVMVYLGAVGAGLRWRLRAKRKCSNVLGFPLALAKFNT
jgi:hypothetical protein